MKEKFFNTLRKDSRISIRIIKRDKYIKDYPIGWGTILMSDDNNRKKTKKRCKRVQHKYTVFHNIKGK